MADDDLDIFQRARLIQVREMSLAPSEYYQGMTDIVLPLGSNYNTTRVALNDSELRILRDLITAHIGDAS